MKSIHEKFGTVISSVCGTQNVDPAFVAALTANETGGNPNKTRFEKNVLLQLWEVEMGRKATFGSIGRADLAAGGGADPFRFLDNLATSWGLTQIMGYESIPFGVSIAQLQDPAAGLRITCRMLNDFSARFGILPKDFSSLFDCWNTGRPHASTADPEYIPNGLRRMSLYAQIAAA